MLLLRLIFFKEFLRDPPCHERGNAGRERGRDDERAELARGRIRAVLPWTLTHSHASPDQNTKPNDDGSSAGR